MSARLVTEADLMMRAEEESKKIKNTMKHEVAGIIIIVVRPLSANLKMRQTLKETGEMIYKSKNVGNRFRVFEKIESDDDREEEKMILAHDEILDEHRESGREIN